MTLLSATIDNGGDYVAAAYSVFLAIILIYVVIMSSKLVRIERKISDIAAHLTGDAPSAEPAEVDSDPAPAAGDAQ